MIDQPPESLVRGCNDPVSIGVLSDWIEEQYGIALDYEQSGWSERNSYDDFYGQGSGDSYGNGYGNGDGIGYGCHDGNGNGNSRHLGNGRGYGYIGGNGKGDGDGYGYNRHHRRRYGRRDGMERYKGIEYGYPP